MSPTRSIAGLLALAFAVASPTAGMAADASNGQTLAKRWCAACHVVASDQQNANGQAPPFSVIGKIPELDPAKLALFLMLPHPKMPDMNLSRNEASDIAAYIVTQGR